MKLKKFLSDQERTELRERHRTEKDRKVGDRIKAILHKDDGWSNRAIARALLIDEDTVAQHISDYRTEQRLKGNQQGSQPKLKTEQSTQLLGHLEQHTYLYVKDIVAHVQNTYRITYTISGMTDWLKHNGFTYKKPKHTPAKANKGLQAIFVHQYEGLKKRLKDDAVILFGDAVHPQHQSKLAYGWIKKGTTKQLPSTPSQKRMNVIGALDLEALSLTTQEITGKVNGDRVIEFCHHLEQTYPHKRLIYWIVDNARYYKSKAVREALQNARVKLIFLPPYSPNLNPIERVWKVMHEHTTYNRYYEKFADFVKAIHHYLTHQLPQHFHILIDRINDNFGLIDLNNPVSHS